MQPRGAEVAGNKDAPVVLVHGLPTSPRPWRHVVHRLEGARSLAWEMVGYGGSIREGVGRDISVRRLWGVRLITRHPGCGGPGMRKEP